MEVRLRENYPEIKLAVATDEAVPSAIGKGEVRPRTIGVIKRFARAWTIIRSTHRMRFEAKFTSKFVRCMSLLLLLEVAAASSGLIYGLSA